MDEIWFPFSQSFSLILESRQIQVQAVALITHQLVVFERTIVEGGVRMLILTKKKKREV